MKILVIEDNRETADFLDDELGKQGFSVDICRDGRSGLARAVTEDHDLIILDLMLPVIDGLTVLKKLRNSQIDIPVIILSAKRSVDDKIAGLQSGSDDYLSKPFSIAELLARIQAITRRHGGKAEAMVSELRAVDLKIDLKRHKVFRENTEIILQPLEYQLLEYLVRHKNSIVTREMIIHDVWDFEFSPRTNIVETRICRLREKIDRPFRKKLIKTIKGCGYVLEDK